MWLAALIWCSILIAAILLYAMRGGHNVTAGFRIPFFRFFFKATKHRGRARRH
jgi:hypothetical protein